jgi:hypothetical protein
MCLHSAPQTIVEYELPLFVACALEVPHQTCLISCFKNYLWPNIKSL